MLSNKWIIAITYFWLGEHHRRGGRKTIKAGQMGELGDTVFWAWHVPSVRPLSTHRTVIT